MAEYASKGVATGGLTTGIIGTSLAGLLALNNGNLLGGLFGNNDKLAALAAENTQLKAQVYTDSQVKDLNAEICGLRQEVTAIKTALPLQQEVTDAKIARVADAANCGISNLQCALNCLQQTVNGVTRTFVPASSVTPMPAPLPFPFEPVMKATAEQPTAAASTGA